MISAVDYGNSLVRIVNRMGGFLTSSRLRIVDFDVDRLLCDATRRTGLSDFGDLDFLNPLDLLLDTYHREAELTLIGRIAMREDILQSLVTRLHLQADRKRFPEIAEARIEAPIFITGLPRSGTTFLHNLLAEDPGLRAPAAWEVMYPSPPPRFCDENSDPRIERAQRRMDQLYLLAPEFRVIHPLDASEPQECIAITSLAFVSDAYSTMCHVPGYQRWLDRADLLPSYKFHRAFLQHLQDAGGSQRWLLKAPAHLFGLRALLDIYPDARLVFTHRDPSEVMPSLANLTMVLQGAFSSRHEPEQIGREMVRHWATGMRRAREIVAQMPDKKERCIDIAYEDLTYRPILTVERLYRHFNLDLGSEARSRMQTYLQHRPKDRYGKHRYSLDQFSLDAGEVERAFSGLNNYCDQ